MKISIKNSMHCLLIKKVNIYVSSIFGEIKSYLQGNWLEDFVSQRWAPRMRSWDFVKFFDSD